MKVDPRPIPLLVALDGSTVAFDQLADDRESQSEALMPSRRAALALRERLEELRHELGFDAGAVVAHLNAGFSTESASAQLDEAAGGRELDHVRQQVPNPPVAGARGSPRTTSPSAHSLSMEMPLLCAFGTTAPQAASMIGLSSTGARVQTHLAGQDSRHVEKVIDQAGECSGAGVDRSHSVFELLLADLAGREDLGPAEDAVQRVAQLVRDLGQEVVLRLGGQFGVDPRPFGLAQQVLHAPDRAACAR